MTKTVKELCTTDISQDEMGNFPESMYELSLIFDKRLKNILQVHEKEITEKDKEIELLTKKYSFVSQYAKTAALHIEDKLSRKEEDNENI